MRTLSTLIGHMSHTSQTGIMMAPLHYQGLQRLHLQTVAQHGHGSRVFIPLNYQALTDLKWWVSESEHLNGCLVQQPPIDATIWSDASKKGWGAAYQGISTGGHWSVEEAKAHILGITSSNLNSKSFTETSGTWGSSHGCLSPGLEQMVLSNPPSCSASSRILRKIRDNQATALLIAPNWSGQPWFPELIQMLVDQPLLLPQFPSLLLLPFQPAVHHPLWQSLHLAVWPFSGVVMKQQAFQRKLLTSCWHQGEQPLRSGTQAHGKHGCAGVLNGVPVPFQLL